MMNADAIMDIGKVLQDARIAKNVSLDTAAQETNIRKAYLEAIEQNDFASLRGDVFVKGVMRTYGNYLGLDGAQLVEEYKASSAGTERVRNNNMIRESRHVKVRPTFKSNRDIGSGNGNEHRLMFIIVGLLALVFAASGGFYFYLIQTGRAVNISLPFRFESVNEAKEQNTEAVKTGNAMPGQGKAVSASQDSKAVPEKKEEEAVKKAVPEKKNAETVKKDISREKTTPVSGMTNLKITSKEKCWLRVTDQKGTVLFQGNILEGESKSFSSQSDIIMRIGNLKALQIEYNGKTLPYEATNEAVTRVYTPAKEKDANSQLKTSN